MVKFCPKMSKGNSQSQNVSTGFVFTCTNNSMTTIVYRGLGPLSTVFTGDDEKPEKYKQEQELQFQLDTLYFQALFYRLQC